MKGSELYLFRRCPGGEAAQKRSRRRIEWRRFRQTGSREARSPLNNLGGGGVGRQRVAFIERETT